MKDEDIISIIEGFDLLEGRNTVNNWQHPETICNRILEIRNRYRSTDMVFRKPTVETDQLYRGLDSLYCRLYHKFELKCEGERK